MKRSTEQRRKSALERAKNTKWEDSKAFRLGTKTQKEWEESR